MVVAMRVAPGPSTTAPCYRGNEVSWTLGRSTVLARQLAGNVALVKLSGFHDTVESTRRFEAWFSRLVLQSGGVHMFWDTEQTTGYKHECVNHTQKEYARGDVQENRAECLFSLLKP